MDINLIKKSKEAKDFKLKIGQVVKEAGSEGYYLVCRCYKSQDKDIFLVDLKTGISYADFEPNVNSEMYVVIDDIELTVKEYK